jgi:hypothetical protein
VLAEDAARARELALSAFLNRDALTLMDGLILAVEDPAELEGPIVITANLDELHVSVADILRHIDD